MEENYEQKEYAIDPDADSRRLYLYRFDRQNEENVKQEQEEKAEQEDSVSEDAQQKGVSESNG